MAMMRSRWNVSIEDLQTRTSASATAHPELRRARRGQTADAVLSEIMPAFLLPP
jgi:hypothetical protein